MARPERDPPRLADRPVRPPYYPCPLCGRLMTSLEMERPPMQPGYLDPDWPLVVRYHYLRPIWTGEPCGHRWTGEATLYLLMQSAEWGEVREVTWP